MTNCLLFLAMCLFLYCKNDVNRYVDVKDACSFTPMKVDQPFKISSNFNCADTLITKLVQGIKKAIYLNQEFVIIPTLPNSYILSVIPENIVKSKLTYNQDLIKENYCKNKFDLSRVNWANPKWDTSHIILFPLIFIIAHEMAHLLNDHNTDLSDNTETRRRRELDADSIAAYIMYRLNIGPIHLMQSTIFKYTPFMHMNGNEDYPPVKVRFDYIEKGYLQAMGDFGLDPYNKFYSLSEEYLNYMLNTGDVPNPQTDTVDFINYLNLSPGVVFSDYLFNTKVPVLFSSNTPPFPSYFKQYLINTEYNIPYRQLYLQKSNLRQVNHEYDVDTIISIKLINDPYKFKLTANKRFVCDVEEDYMYDKNEIVRYNAFVQQKDTFIKCNVKISQAIVLDGLKELNKFSKIEKNNKKGSRKSYSVSDTISISLLTANPNFENNDFKSIGFTFTKYRIDTTIDPIDHLIEV